MQFVNSAKRLVFDLTEIPSLKCLINIYCLIAIVLNDQNLFTESNLVNWFSSYVQFCSGGHFSKPAEAAPWCGKMNHLNRGQGPYEEIFVLTFKAYGPNASTLNVRTNISRIDRNLS